MSPMPNAYKFKSAIASTKQSREQPRQISRKPSRLNGAISVESQEPKSFNQTRAQFNIVDMEKVDLSSTQHSKTSSKRGNNNDLNSKKSTNPILIEHRSFKLKPIQQINTPLNNSSDPRNFLNASISMTKPVYQKYTLQNRNGNKAHQSVSSPRVSMIRQTLLPKLVANNGTEQQNSNVTSPSGVTSPEIVPVTFQQACHSIKQTSKSIGGFDQQRVLPSLQQQIMMNNQKKLQAPQQRNNSQKQSILLQNQLQSNNVADVKTINQIQNPSTHDLSTVNMFSTKKQQNDESSVEDCSSNHAVLKGNRPQHVFRSTKGSLPVNNPTLRSPPGALRNRNGQNNSTMTTAFTSNQGAAVSRNSKFNYLSVWSNVKMAGHVASPQEKLITIDSVDIQ